MANEREPWRQNGNGDTATFRSRKLEEIPVPTIRERVRDMPYNDGVTPVIGFPCARGINMGVRATNDI